MTQFLQQISQRKRETEELKILKDLKICQSIAMCAPNMDSESNKQTKIYI